MTGTLAPEAGHTVLPPENLTVLRALASFVESHGQHAALVGPDGERVDLPEAVNAVLLDVVRAMRGGLAITVAHTSTRLTTQEAADLLGVSRPTLVKLLESGRIPYERPGRHRRVRLADLLVYRDAASTERVTALDELTRQAASTGTTTAPPVTTARRSSAHDASAQRPPVDPVRRLPGRLRPRTSRPDRHPTAAGRPRTVPPAVVPAGARQGHRRRREIRPAHSRGCTGGSPR